MLFSLPGWRACWRINRQITAGGRSVGACPHRARCEALAREKESKEIHGVPFLYLHPGGSKAAGLDDRDEGHQVANKQERREKDPHDTRLNISHGHHPTRYSAVRNGK